MTSGTSHQDKKQKVNNMAGPQNGASSEASCWIEYGPECQFPIQNLPFGIFSTDNHKCPRVGVAIGDKVLDLSVIAETGCFKDFDPSCFSQPALNDFMELGKAAWTSARKTIQSLLSASNASLRDNEELQSRALIPMDKVKMHLPARIGDYTDFYASRHHATNVGIMFRGRENALQPNWLHLPVGYHGRASSIVVSGTDLHRPHGQLQKDIKDPKQGSVFGASKRVDYEVEVGIFVGKGNELGQPVTMEEAEDRIFGLVLLNDWSARDIQKWEYVPLGPFGAKNFGSTISPWVVTLDALKPFRCSPGSTVEESKQDPVPLEYLQDKSYAESAFDVKLEVAIKGESQKSFSTVGRTNLRHMYWNIKQQLVHHTITGCNMRAGDMLGTGTISGPEEGSAGCLLEATWNGKNPVKLEDGSERTFIQDMDEVLMTGYCQGDGYRIGFGECVGKILPAKQL